MDFAYTPEDEAFRAELLGWLDKNLPPFLEEWADRGDDDDAGGAGAGGVLAQMERRRAWQRKLNEGRWAAITWPAEWGGREATATQSMIYSEEMAKARTPGIYNANGLWQIGPMIIKWGTDEQKDLWIPNILQADDHWCQGFSEPQAGSDLANLRTLAIRESDDPDEGDYVLNGSKIWISSAHLARWGLFLVRTDATAIEEGRKHDGITALIIDMEADGIEVRPIRDLAGEEMFCEIFFTDARVPVKFRLGNENEGWLVAMGTLGSERVGTAGAESDPLNESGARTILIPVSYRRGGEMSSAGSACFCRLRRRRAATYRTFPIRGVLFAATTVSGDGRPGIGGLWGAFSWRSAILAAGRRASC